MVWSYMQRRVTNATVKMSEFIQVEGTKKDKRKNKNHIS